VNQTAAEQAVAVLAEPAPDEAAWFGNTTVRRTST
jgi:hypothetical protein